MDQICPKRVILVQKRGSEHRHRILHIRISLDVNFHFKQTILTLGTKFDQREYFQSKMKKVNITIKFCIFELGNKFQFRQTILIFWTTQFWFFGPNFPKKRISSRKQKSEHDHWILHIRSSLGTKFKLKLTTLIFWTKFAQK